jgi:polygalacturonase
MRPALRKALLLTVALAGVGGCAGLGRETAGPSAGRSPAPGASAAIPSAAHPPVIDAPRIPERRCPVTERGARGDGLSDDSAAINRTIAACSEAGGGTVYFAPGTYLAASVRLRSRVRLQLAAGATLKAAESGYEPPEPNPFDRYQDFGHSHFRNALIWGENLTDVAIEGPGTIDGRALRSGNARPGQGDKQVAIKSSQRLAFANLTQVGGGHFFYLLTDCLHLTMTNLDMRDGRDGVDLVGCSRVDLRNLKITDCGDDTIALKSDYSTGKRLRTEDVLVRDSVVESGCNGLQFGSETAGDFRRVRFANIQILRGGKAGIGVQTNDGAIIEDVVFENITIQRAANPIFVNTTRRLRTPEPVQPGRVRNLVIRNVTATEVVQTHRAEPANAATISGLPGIPHENLLLENVTITYKGGGQAADAQAVPEYSNNYNPRKLGPRPAYGFYVRHVRGLTFRNVKVAVEAPDLRPAFAVMDADGLVFESVATTPSPEPSVPVLQLRAVRGLTIRNSPPLPPLHDSVLSEAKY